MRECIAGGTKSKAENIATALNSVLNQLIAVADLEVAVAGYRGDDSNGADVGCRWGGPLAGRRFVPTAALADAPLVVENRIRRLGTPIAGKEEETVPFPIWYVPRIGGSILPVLGYAYCRHLVVAGTTPETVWDKPPLVISFVGDLVPQQMEMAVERVLGLSSPGGPPLLLPRASRRNRSRTSRALSVQRHPPPAGPCVRLVPLVERVAGLYDRLSSQVAQVPVSTGARGMIYNASVADLIRMLSLVKAYAQQRVLDALQPEGRG